jgi:hypothetical protein
MKLNNDIRCLIETLFNRVIDFNESSDKNEFILKVTKQGISLQNDHDIWYEKGNQGNVRATNEEQLAEMYSWLSYQILLIEKGEEDPKAEAQKELDREQI